MGTVAAESHHGRFLTPQRFHALFRSRSGDLSGLALGPLEWRRITALGVFAVVAAVTLDLLFRKIFKLDLT